MVNLGKNLIIYIDGHAMAASKTCTIEKTTKLIEVSSPVDVTYKHYITGISSWTVSVSGLVTRIDQVLNAGIQVWMTCQLATQPGKKWLSGYMICNKANIQANVGNLAVGSYSFVGNGELYGDSNPET